MKKRIISLVLAFAMVASLSITAFATDVNASALTLSMSDTLVTLKIGESSSLTASLMGLEAEVTWSSSNGNVARVNSNGTVTAVGYGRTTVTAKTVDGSYGTSVVQVAYRGIDVAKYQGAVDWNTVKASGINFVMMKATEGVDYIDPYFTTNASGAAAAGLNTGAYHYLRAGDVQEQARQCIAALRPYHWTYPIAVDVEDADLMPYGKAGITTMVIQFCEAIKAAGYTPMIYSNPNWCTNYLDMSRLSSYNLWLANYGVDYPSYSKPFTMWQYSSSGSVPGIIGNVDMDDSYMDYSASLKCDTTVPYTFGSNSVYCYKITTPSTTIPVATSSNSAAVSVAYYGKTTGGYLYKITNVNSGSAEITTTGSNGTSVSFIANGRANGLVSDTTTPFTMKLGGTYQFKFTATGTSVGVPRITTGNGSVLRPTLVTKIGNSYYCKFNAVGRGCTGVYTTLPNQKPVIQCVVTVK